MKVLERFPCLVQIWWAFCFSDPLPYWRLRLLLCLHCLAPVCVLQKEVHRLGSPISSLTVAALLLVSEQALFRDWFNCLHNTARYCFPTTEQNWIFLHRVHCVCCRTQRPMPQLLPVLPWTELPHHSAGRYLSILRSASAYHNSCLSLTAIGRV